MKTRLQGWLCLGLLLLAAHVAGAQNAAHKIKVLLVTGGHAFETNKFYQVFQENPEIALTIASHSKTNASVFDRSDLTGFDVVVLYDMEKSITDAQKKNFLALFDQGTGLVVLHHALASYQHWPEYEQIIGGLYPEADGKSGKVTEQVGYQHGEEVPIVVVAKDHPITAGVKDFTVHDEIYWGFRVGSDVTPLITTTHPKSGKPLAWYRTQGKSRVVYLQLGHDHTAYENPNYQKLVAQSIRWVARR